MMLPCLFFHSHTRSRNFSRPNSRRPIFSSFLIFFSTTTCVEIPAWSVPGSHNTSFPSIRALRARMSWIVLFSTWPMCKIPVTFGGGITIEYAGFFECGSPTKQRCSIQNSYHLDSTTEGSYVLEISDMLPTWTAYDFKLSIILKMFIK